MHQSAGGLNRAACPVVRRSFSLLLVAVLVFSALALAASTECSSAASASSRIPTDKVGLWDQTFNLRAGLGYKDNLTLSSVAPEESGFFLSEAEFTLMRLPLDGHELLFLGMLRDVRYFSGEEVDSEQLALVLAQYRRHQGNGWKTGASLRYVYLDQVFDVSVTETNLGSVQVRGHSVRLAPYVRKDLAKQIFIELEPALNRQWFAEPLDDYWEPGTRLTVGKQYGRKSEASLNYEYSRRLYDERQPYTRNREPIPGESLAYDQHEIALRVRHNWDQAKHWQTTSRLSYYLSQDNGSGYFDYDRYQFLQQVRFQAGKWELKSQVRLNYYHFPVQTVSEDDQSLRHRLTMAASARAQYQITKQLRVFTEYEYEQTWSNVDFDRYTVNSVSSGLDYEW